MSFRYRPRDYEEILDDILEAIADGEKIQGVDLSDVQEADKSDALARIDTLRQSGDIDIDAWDYERQYDAYDHRNEE